MPKNYADLLNLEKRFEQYLELVGLDKFALSPIQLTETKRAFMGGIGSTLVLMMQDIDGLNEEESINSLSSLMVQVDNFWRNESGLNIPSIIPN